MIDSVLTVITRFHNAAKCREPIFFPTRCVLSTTAPPVSTESTVLNLEKLKLSSLEVHSNSTATDRHWSSSSSSSSTGVLDIENFQLPSLEPHTNSIGGSRPWAYTAKVNQVRICYCFVEEIVSHKILHYYLSIFI